MAQEKEVLFFPMEWHTRMGHQTMAQNFMETGKGLKVHLNLLTQIGVYPEFQRLQATTQQH